MKKSLLVGSIIVLASLASSSICRALPQKDRGADVVVAAEDLPIGTQLEEGVLRIVTVPSSFAPVGIYNSTLQVIGRIVSLPLIKDEVLLPGKLAPEDSSTFRHFPVVAAIPVVSVRANNVVPAEDGSVPLGRTRADVLLAKSASGPRDPQADDIWLIVPVLAVTSRVERSDEGDTQLRPVVTFVLNTIRDQDALSLAGAQHRVWVALRDMTDAGLLCTSDTTPLNGKHAEGPILTFHRDLHGCCEDSSTTDVRVFADGMVALTEKEVNYVNVSAPAKNGASLAGCGRIQGATRESSHRRGRGTNSKPVSIFAC